MDNDKPCPFCGSRPQDIREIYPNAKRRVGCPMMGCPASGKWVTPDVWNRRLGEQRKVDMVMLP